MSRDYKPEPSSIPARVQRHIDKASEYESKLTKAGPHRSYTLRYRASLHRAFARELIEVLNEQK